MGILVQVTDGIHGLPAAGLEVRLLTDVDGYLQETANGTTDFDGVVPGWADKPITCGVHQVLFDLDRYYASLGVEPRFPKVVVAVRVVDPTERYEIPMLITPYFFSTFCGR